MCFWLRTKLDPKIQVTGWANVTTASQEHKCLTLLTVGRNVLAPEKELLGRSSCLST